MSTGVSPGHNASVLSMAAGEWVSVSSQRDAESVALEVEQAELDADPLGEQAKLVGLLVRPPDFHLTRRLVGLTLPDATPNTQILARTNPDLRDLGVAVLAGTAGAYVRTRP